MECFQGKCVLLGEYLGCALRVVSVCRESVECEGCVQGECGAGCVQRLRGEQGDEA